MEWRNYLYSMLQFYLILEFRLLVFKLHFLREFRQCYYHAVWMTMAYTHLRTFFLAKPFRFQFHGSNTINTADSTQNLSDCSWERLNPDRKTPGKQIRSQTEVTSMLVTDVGDQMCWWQVWDVGDRFRMLVTDLIHWENHQHNAKSRQHNDSATNIWNQSPS